MAGKPSKLLIAVLMLGLAGVAGAESQEQTGHSMHGNNNEIDPMPDEPVDHPCIEDPVFPADCVDQLGPIGGPPTTPNNEGFLNIAGPVVDPLLLLTSSNASNGLLYALNPLNSRVRVLDPADGLAVVRDIRVCYRPSAVTQNADGSEVLVACHASDAVAVIRTDTNRVVELIQDRDDDLRPLLQEPMGMAVSGNLLYVASSQDNRVAVVNLTTRRVVRSILLPGQDPRDVALAPGGNRLVVANFMAGNRTEPSMLFNTSILVPGNPAGDVCAPILEADPTAIHVIDETHPDFMNVDHPQYPVLAECYFFAHTFGTADQVVVNPARTDHDLVVVDLANDAALFSTNSLPQPLGTLNYGVQFDPAGDRVYLATVEARNNLNAGFGKRPLLNRLVILDYDSSSGALSVHAIRDLDEPFLDDNGDGTSIAATPYALAVTDDRVLIAAAGSDRLVVTDTEGNFSASVRVGFTPKGVIADGDFAYVYNATGLSISKVDLNTNQQVATAGIGNNPMPQSARIGAHLFNSGRFAANKSFACASCHPDGHLDGLVWKLNDEDGLRSTMTLQEITETAPYHWDGSKCNLVKVLQDGIVNLFGDPDGPTDCEMKTMIDFMEGLLRPHSPFSAPDDRFSDQAALGLAILHRGRFKNPDDTVASCTGVIPDPAVEAKYLKEIGDPFKEQFDFNGGGGPFPNTLVAETCSTANCHATPHWSSLGKVAGIEAVSTHGLWDRMVTHHDAFTTRVKGIEALEINRTYNGAAAINPGDNYTGKLATHAFTDSFFRHTEYNHDDDPEGHGFTLAESLTRFMLEEEELQSGAVGLSVALSQTGLNSPEKLRLRDLLEQAAAQGKIALLSVGTIGGVMTSLTWDAATSSFTADGGGPQMSMTALTDAMTASDTMVLYGVLPPGQGTVPHPKLDSVTRDTSPILCAEDPPEYHANVQTGETDVALVFHGIDVTEGSKVLVEGQVTGTPLSGPGPDFEWTLPRVPDTPAVLSLRVLSPTGMQSNSIALPVVPPVVAAFEPDDVAADKPQIVLTWTDQFGITGPGTRYDVFRGSIRDLRTFGLTTGSCFAAAGVPALVQDDEVPAPGNGFYYVIRAQNQVNVTTWGSAKRDQDAGGSGADCPVLF
jgi:YVTN family beta-propeller protein